MSIGRLPKDPHSDQYEFRLVSAPPLENRYCISQHGHANWTLRDDCELCQVEDVMES